MSLWKWHREPKGLEIKTRNGKAITSWFRQTCNHKKLLGLTCMPVLFGDHRSGWSALQVVIGLFWWEWVFYPLVWRTPPRKEVVYVSLADQVRRDHKIAMQRLPDDDD